MATDLDLARADSRDCPFCNGEGMRTVFAPGYDGDAIVRTAKIALMLPEQRQLADVL